MKSAPRTLTALIAGLLVVGGFALGADRAMASWFAIAENGLAGHLWLQSDRAAPMQLPPLSPGGVEHWQIQANLIDESAALTLQFTRDGTLVTRPDGLMVLARMCSVEWNLSVDPVQCPGVQSPVFGPVAAGDLASLGPLTSFGVPDASTPVFPLGTLTNDAPSYLLMTLSIPDTPAARADRTLMGLSATIGLGLTATGGDDVRAPNLAATGIDLISLSLVGLGVVLFGVALRSRRAKARS